jgi:WD40 repeat protein
LTIAVTKGHIDTITSLLKFEEKLISGSFDSSIIKWDTNNGTQVANYPGLRARINSLALDADFVYSAGEDYAIRQWTKNSGNLPSKLEGHTSFVFSVDFNDNGFLVSGANDKTVRVWNVNTREPTLVLEGHTGAVNIVYNYKNFVFSGDTDQTVIMWDIETGAIVKKFTDMPGPVSHINADDNKMYVGAKDTASIWKISSGDRTELIALSGFFLIS